MKQEYITILNMRKQFSGIDNGFVFLDNLIDFLKTRKSCNEEIDKLKVYDYRDNFEFVIICNYQKLYAEIQQMYFDFVLNYYQNKSLWYKNFYTRIYEQFSKTFSNAAIVAFLKLFNRALISAAKNGDYTFSKIDVNINIELQFYRDRNVPELELEFIKSEFMTVFNKMNNLELFKWVLQFTSYCLPPFYSETNVDLRCNSFSEFKKLQYIPHLAVMTNNLLSKDYINYYYKHNIYCYNLITNCYDFNIDFDVSKVKHLEIVEFFFRRNLLLNDFLFQTIVTTCFETKNHAAVPNVLFQKHEYAEIIDPEIKNI